MSEMTREMLDYPAVNPQTCILAVDNPESGYCIVPASAMRRYAESHDALLCVVRQMIEAVDSGNLQMSSPEIGEPENNIPIHPWHEELLYYARQALAVVGSPHKIGKYTADYSPILPEEIAKRDDALAELEANSSPVGEVPK